MPRPSIGGLSLIALLLSLFTGACRHNSSAAPPGRHSNILLIIADDLGNEKVGVYGEGDDQTRPKTPHIDKLAHRGVRFVNAYASPYCSPTRAMLLTGQYSFRNGIGFFIASHTETMLPLFPTLVPIPIMLDRGGSGYDHSQVGKWHLASNRVGGPRNPLDHGFNWSAGSIANLGNCKDCDYYSWIKQVNGSISREHVYATSDTTNDAIARANEMQEPWFMWLAYNAPHQPFHVPPRDLHSQPDPQGDDVSMYAAMVEALDTEIGRLLASIEPARLANTTIIFLGDNGTPRPAIPPPYNQNAAKGTLRENGINIPFIVAGPVIPPSSRGRTSSAMVNATDVFATVAEIADVDLNHVLPANYALDSVSLIPSLREPDRTNGARRHAYAEVFKPNGPGPYEFHSRSMLDGRWKLFRRVTSEPDSPVREMLFDLSRAAPGTDGDDLCPCPENLEAEARTAFERLHEAMEALGSS